MQAIDTSRTPATTARRRPRSGSGMAGMERTWGWLLAGPAVLGFLLLTIGPMIASFVIGMTDWRVGAQPSFVGLDNYSAMLNDETLHNSIRATLTFTLMAIPLLLVIALGAAILLNQNVRGRGVFRTIFYLPVLVPTVANAVLWLWMFNPDFGLFNGLLRQFGLPGSQWIYSSSTSVASLAIMTAWSFGNAAVIFLAGLQGVPRELYEAVDCDGGGPISKFRHITLPMLTPIIFYNLVVGVIAALQTFTEAYVMTNGGPNDSTLFYVLYLFRTAFTDSRLGYASALSWVLFVIVLVITFVLFGSARRWVYYRAGEG